MDSHLQYEDMWIGLLRQSAISDTIAFAFEKGIEGY